MPLGFGEGLQITGKNPIDETVAIVKLDASSLFGSVKQTMLCINAHERDANPR